MKKMKMKLTIEDRLKAKGQFYPMVFALAKKQDNPRRKPRAK